jgi:hypothetical protein
MQNVVAIAVRCWISRMKYKGGVSMEDYKAIRYIEYHGHIDDEVKDIAIKAIKELHKY